MSLLMDALRKAEEAKRRIQQLEEREPDVSPEWLIDNFVTDHQDAGVHEDTAHQELAAAESRRASQADLASYFATDPEPEDAVIAPFATAAGARLRQRAAAAVFTAKQKPAVKRPTLRILLAILVLLLPMGTGAYWYLLNAPANSVGINAALAGYDLSSRGLVGEASPPAVAIPPDLDMPDTAATPVAEDVQDVAAATATEEQASATATAALAEAVSAATPPQPATPPVPAAAQPAGAAAAQTVAAATTGLTLPAGRPATTLQITRSPGSRQRNPGLLAAYERLQAGDDLHAGQLYQTVLAELPNNRDALLGLALVQFRQGDAAAARALYARQLQLNPRDPLARTGLLQTMQDINPREHENELKALLSQYPEVAPLSYALGNLYAGQERWSEAQGAYFTALLQASRGSDGPVHPDYAFNLAVSLEQLNQPGPALDYYRQASELALVTPPGFDPAILRSRLAWLEQTRP